MTALTRTKSLADYDKLPSTITSKRRHKKSLSLIKEIPTRMTHAEAASLCTKIVTELKGHPIEIKEQCAKVRKLYFSQYRMPK